MKQYYVAITNRQETHILEVQVKAENISQALQKAYKKIIEDDWEFQLRDTIVINNHSIM